jgi:hypothetical protein
MGSLLEGGHLAVAQLVEDPAGVLVAEVVQAGALAKPELAQGRGGKLTGANGSACRLVRMLSRPNMVINQGSPAAGRLWRPALIGENRSAARSTRLRR